MIRESLKKVAGAVGEGLFRETSIKLAQHYHDNTKKLIKTEEVSRTAGRLFRLAKGGEKATTQIMDEKSFAVLALVEVSESEAPTPPTPPTVEEVEVAKPKPPKVAKAPKPPKAEPAPEAAESQAEASEPAPPQVDVEASSEEEESTDDGNNEEDDMAAKKTTKKAAKKTTKTAKPKAAAKPKKVKAVAKPKTPKAAKPKKVKAAKVAKPKKAKAAGDAPTTGQSGPPVDFSKKNPNPKETRVLSALNHGSGPKTIGEIADECWKSLGKAKANSNVRNSMRRLVRGGLVEHCDRGTYKLTAKGKKAEATE
jgi:DNA polymerase III gamma/tau subunit